MYNRTFRGKGQRSNFVHPEDLLEDGLYELGLDEQLAGDDRLMEYITELMNWNRIYNLTSVRKPTEIVTRHILDSLTVLPHLHGNNNQHRATGAGLDASETERCVVEIETERPDHGEDSQAVHRPMPPGGGEA